MFKSHKLLFSVYGEIVFIGIVFFMSIMVDSLFVVDNYLMLYLVLLVFNLFVFLRIYYEASGEGAFSPLVMVLLSFVFSYSLSSIFHLVNPYAQERGFYDLLRGYNGANKERIYYSVIMMIVAYYSMLIGAGKNSYQKIRIVFNDMSIPSVSLLLYGFAILIISLYSVYVLIEKYFGGYGYISALTNVDRSIEIGDGMARYVFMSQWLIWGFLFILTGVYGKTYGKNYRRSVLYIDILVLFGFILIVLSGFWRGGRGAGIVGMLPLLMLLSRLNYSIKRVSVVFLLIAVANIIILTFMRTEGPKYGVESIVDVLDWHSGRFSMIGLAQEIQENQGFKYGSTMIAGIVDILNVPTEILGMPSLVSSPISASVVATKYLFGINGGGVSPGSIFELYINYGFVGVGVGYYCLGFMIKRLSWNMSTTRSVEVYYFNMIYVIFISTSLIPGGFSGWIYRLFTTGVPVFIYLIIKRNRLVIKRG